MRKFSISSVIFAALLLIAPILTGCGGRTISPVATIVDVDELYGNYSLDFDYSSFNGKSVKANFFDIEIYDIDECREIKKGDIFIYNNNKDRLEVKSVESKDVPIKGTDMTDSFRVINDEFKLVEGSNFCSLSPIEGSEIYYRATGEVKTLKFSDDFVFYPNTSGSDAIYDADKAFKYLKSHPELDHTCIDAAIDDDTILAIRYIQL